MKKFFMMLPLMVALVAFVGCSKTTDDPVEGENLNEDSRYYDQFNIANCGIFGEEPELVPGTQTTMDVQGAGEVTVQLAYFDFYAWDGSLNYNETSGEFTGKGLLISGKVPVYMIMEGEYAGSIINPTTGCYRVENTSAASEGVMAAGVIDRETYGDWVNYEIFEGEEPDQDKIFKKTNGTLLSESDIPQNIQEDRLGLYRGAIKRMVINLGAESEVTSWGADVEWSNMTGDQRCYGFHFNPETNTMTKPYNYRSLNRKFHEDVLNAPQQAPAVNATRTISVNDLRKAYPAVKK
ncbi:MAG: hypothetical protein MJ002_01130 [Paludibacteraceae bacterium]|nr:hypothetical protein [Paludibacteraceae bacterium]